MTEAPRTTRSVPRQIETLVRLRIVVSVLGEAAHAKWWRTEFLTAAGLRFLDRLYPRTNRTAALHSAGTAAREMHDTSIGRGGVYHLFRLPEPLEGQYRALARDGHVDELVREIEPILGDRTALLTQLDVLAGGGPEAAPGPQRIGNVRDLNNGASLGRWASAYGHAFRNDYRVFPYVETEA